MLCCSLALVWSLIPLMVDGWQCATRTILVYCVTFPSLLLLYHPTHSCRLKHLQKHSVDGMDCTDWTVVNAPS